MTTRKEYYWIAINGASVAVLLTVPLSLDEVRCCPTPQGLFGFKTAAEALAAQQFVLNGDINAVRRFLDGKTGKNYPSRWMAMRIFMNPEPPTRGATVWTNAKNAPSEAEPKQDAA